MSVQRAATYGDRHAEVYDRLYGARFVPHSAIRALAKVGGPVLELGLGTGRLAIPLAASGVVVDGIEASTAMIFRLRAQPGGERVNVFRADLASFDLPRQDYAAAVCAVSTLFMLPGPRRQRGCVASAARHLRPDGRLFIEAFRPDPTRFDADGRRSERRATLDGTAHVVRSVHDPDRQCIRITHVLSGDRGSAEYAVTLYYATPEQIDAMAGAAGMQLIARWHDWAGAPATGASTDPVSVYRRMSATRAPVLG